MDRSSTVNKYLSNCSERQVGSSIAMGRNRLGNTLELTGGVSESNNI